MKLTGHKTPSIFQRYNIVSDGDLATAARMSGDVFHFGKFTLQATERRLLQGPKVVRLSPKAHDVLVVLLQQSRHLVTKDELLSRVWADAIVEEGILTGHISALRKALGDGRRSNGYIETVSRSGYRFVAPVSREQSDHETERLQASRDPTPLKGLRGSPRGCSAQIPPDAGG